MIHGELRAELVRVGRALVDHGLTRGTSGNVSARTPAGMLITPSGVPWGQLTAEMLVELPLGTEEITAAGGITPDAGIPATGGITPNAGLEATAEITPLAVPARVRASTEWRLHACILAARPEIAGVVHAHPPFATALACLRRGIPPFHYLVAAAGGHDIPCAPYATFGTAELAEAVVETLGGRRACLMANHGMVALGSTLDAALALAVEVEALAEQYCRALQLGEPVLLSDEEMGRVTRAFEGYRGEAPGNA
jgi:L-fuculose-phosphate aldolase